MSIAVQMISSSPPVLDVLASGKIDRADYERLGPDVESLIQAHGDIRILLRLVDFDGWTAGALWEDIKFDVKHFSDIDRLAIVGEQSWEKGMATFCKPFTKAEVRFFTPDKIDRARDWLGVATPAAGGTSPAGAASTEAG